MHAFAAAAALVVLAADPHLEAMKAIERDLQQGNTQTLDQRFSLRRLIEDKVVEKGSRSGYTRGFIQGVGERSFGTQLVNAVQAGGSITFLRLFGRPTERRALFRIINADGGVGYFEFHLSADEKGGTRVDDVYVYSSGELFSTTMRRLYVTGRGQAEQGVLDRLMGKERSFIDNAPKLKKMVEDLRAQRWEEVMATYDSLPDAVKHERSTAIMNLAASAQLEDGTRYVKAFNTYEKLFPGDPSLDLFAIDAHFHRKQWDGALAAIDRLDRRTKDPYLDVLRASVDVARGQFAGAKTAARRAIDREPTLEKAWWVLVNVSLQEKNHADTARLLGDIETKLGLKIVDLSQLPEYAEFVKSAQYRAWLKRH